MKLNIIQDATNSISIIDENQDEVASIITSESGPSQKDWQNARMFEKAPEMIGVLRMMKNQPKAVKDLLLYIEG